MDDLKWIGHASFLLSVNGKNVYIDPFNLQTGKVHADIILITHPHFDHFSTQDIEKVADANTRIFAPMELKEKIRIGKVTGVEPNKKYSADGIEIETVPAYNVNKERLDKHPRTNNWVGYIIKAGGKSWYHAGDTDFIPEMKKIEVDVALLPMSGTYTMDVHEAVEAARAIKAKQYTPMHYKQVLGKEASEKAEVFFKSKIKNTVLLKEIQEAKYSFQ
jgi:L-ascorbate metabolism protein UlaG (beta-lactamase superfamily)